MDGIVLVVAFALILLGAELFTNGVEWFGHKLELAEGAVGSVLAAVGTALPETTIPIVAILFSGDRSATEAVGIGAILGAPFMLATLAMFVTGVAVAWRGRASGPGRYAMRLDPAVLSSDVRAFALSYAVAIAAALILPAEPGWPKAVVAVGLLGLYARYVKAHLDAETAAEGELRPLRFHRLERAHVREAGAAPRLRIVSVQVVAALGCIVAGALFFVGAVEDLSRSLGVSEVLLALVVAPIATELPEKLNSVIWIRQRKDTLALGNITGAMVFQAAIPTSVALLFAPAAWSVGGGSELAFASAAIAFLSTGAVFWPAFRGRELTGRRLLVGGIFYAAYVAVVLTRVGG